MRNRYANFIYIDSSTTSRRNSIYSAFYSAMTSIIIIIKKISLWLENSRMYAKFIYIDSSTTSSRNSVYSARTIIYFFKINKFCGSKIHGCI
jgi:hypothetical protein